MFLKQLYHFNKLLFTFLVVFILGMLVVFCKWGAVATPIYQYGMFSKHFNVTDTQQVLQIYVNDTIVDYSNFNQHDIDMTQEVIYNYKNQKKNNYEILNTFQNLYSKIGITHTINKINFKNSLSDDEFINWFATKVPNKTAVNPFKMAVKQNNYFLNNSKLTFISSLLIIDSCAFNN